MKARPPRLVSVACAVLTVGIVPACGGDSGMGPDESSVQFPALPPAVTGAWCIRGLLTSPVDRSGTLDATDCDTAFTAGVLDTPVGVGPGSSFETWRLRVNAASTISIEASSTFDNFLDVYRVPDFADLGSAIAVAFDDDSGSDLDALVVATVLPGFEYWVMVSGFDPGDTGFYTLTVRRANP